jgi:hypothetical protein
MRSSVPAALGLAVIALTARPAMASRESDALRARGAAEINSLDRDQAMATFFRRSRPIPRTRQRTGDWLARCG